MCGAAAGRTPRAVRVAAAGARHRCDRRADLDTRRLRTFEVVGSRIHPSEQLAAGARYQAELDALTAEAEPDLQRPAARALLAGMDLAAARYFAQHRDWANGSQAVTRGRERAPAWSDWDAFDLAQVARAPREPADPR